jgi:hypothetical protein
MMVVPLARRMLTEADPRVLWKFTYNFGYKGVRSVQKFKQRLKRGEHFPPFLYISIINSCNLRCQGCWVKVDGPQHYIDAPWTGCWSQAKAAWGGRSHPSCWRSWGGTGCYFQIFSSNHFVRGRTPKRRPGNARPDQRRRTRRQRPARGP